MGGTYTLPPGYGMFNGTSMASPQAAGAAALLISAAKQDHHTPDYGAAQLRTVFNSTARFIDRYNAADQGNGLIDVDKAWKLLKKGVDPVNIKSRVAVHTLLSDFLEEPGFGPGIYDREGVTVGQRYTRTYTFTRTSGPNRQENYKLRWVGNDGTFRTDHTIKLGLNQPKTLDVEVNPSDAAGSTRRSSQLQDGGRHGIAYETMNTVIAPDVLTAANGYSVTKTGSVGRNQVLRYFFKVPAGNPVLKVDFSGPDGNPGTGQARFLRFHPYGVGVDSNASTSCYAPPVAGCATGSPYSRTVNGALAGVWEVTVEARRTSDVASTPFTLTASLFGVAITPNPDVIPNAQVGVPVPRSYSFQNNFATFTGNAVGSDLGSARRGVFTIADGERAGLHHDDPCRLDVVPRDDRQSVGRSCGSRPVRLPVQPIPHARRGRCAARVRTATRRSRSRSRILRPAPGRWRSTASRSRRDRRRTTTSTSSPTRGWARSQSPIRSRCTRAGPRGQRPAA